MSSIPDLPHRLPPDEKVLKKIEQGTLEYFDVEAWDNLNTGVLEEYLEANKIEQSEKDWIVKKVPRRVHDLHNQRNKAEHESGKKWTRDEIGKYYREFVGVGVSGILPRLAKVLFR